MDVLWQLPGGISSTVGLPWDHLVPYAIILLNTVIFRLLRALIRRVLARYLAIGSSGKRRASDTNPTHRIIKLFFDELISTIELCADCAELNVVYELHGSTAYGATLAALTYVWIETFGEAHTTPGYLAEDYFLIDGNKLLKSGETYVRLAGQVFAIPLAWRFASLYWHYQLLEAHSSMLATEKCKTSLTTSTLNGFLIEGICCFLCRMIELISSRLFESKYLSMKSVSIINAFSSSALVVLALELSGGYFNPVLAASLEYGCLGIESYQHAMVFWNGPLIGHIVARLMYRTGAAYLRQTPGSKVSFAVTQQQQNEVRRTRSQRKKKKD